MKLNTYLLMVLIGSIMIASSTIVSLSSVEYVQIQTSSPVAEGEVCSIDIRIKAGVGVSGTANLFIDEVFYQSIGGTSGSDGVMYFSTGWNAVGVGNHVLRVAYFEEGYPTEPFGASTVITVLDSGVSPPPPPPPDDDPIEFPELTVLSMQLCGGALAFFGGYNYFIKNRKGDKD